MWICEVNPEPSQWQWPPLVAFEKNISDFVTQLCQCDMARLIYSMSRSCLRVRCGADGVPIILQGHNSVVKRAFFWQITKITRTFILFFSPSSPPPPLFFSLFSWLSPIPSSIGGMEHSGPNTEVVSASLILVSLLICHNVSLSLILKWEMRCNSAWFLQFISYSDL